MREYFQYRLAQEDELMFVVTDALTHYPETVVIGDLKSFIACHQQRVQSSGTPRAEEMEVLATEFAALLTRCLEKGKSPPHQKSYALQT